MLLLCFLDVLFSYRDQFAMLADGIARERYEMEVREKAQEKVSYLPDCIRCDCTRSSKYVHPVWFHYTHVVCCHCAFVIRKF